MANLTAKQKEAIIAQAEKELDAGSTGQALGGFITGKGGLGTELFGTAEDIWNKLAPGVHDPTVTAAKKKKEQKKAAAPSGPTAAQRQAYAIASSPWTQASQTLASGLNTDINALSGLASGSALGAIDQNTNAMAGALTGTPQSSGAGQWLAAQSAAANAATAPVAAAMQGQENAFTTGENPFSQALLNMGQANALAVETAPQAGWYNAVQSHILSNANYYGSVPAAAKSVFQNDPALAQAMVQSGGYGAGGTGTGLIPITSLAPGGGGSNALTSAAGTVATASPVSTPGISPTA